MTRTSFEQEVLQRLSVIETILTDVRQDIEGTKHTLHGNGQPGMAQRLTTVETKVDERTSKKQVIGVSGTIVAILTVGAEVLKAKLGL